jgi:hypothetical protein
MHRAACATRNQQPRDETHPDPPCAMNQPVARYASQKGHRGKTAIRHHFGRVVNQRHPADLRPYSARTQRGHVSALRARLGREGSGTGQPGRPDQVAGLRRRRIRNPGSLVSCS